MPLAINGFHRCNTSARTSWQAGRPLLYVFACVLNVICTKFFRPSHHAQAFKRLTLKKNIRLQHGKHGVVTHRSIKRLKNHRTILTLGSCRIFPPPIPSTYFARYLRTFDRSYLKKKLNCLTPVDLLRVWEL